MAHKILETAQSPNYFFHLGIQVLALVLGLGLGLSITNKLTPFHDPLFIADRGSELFLQCVGRSPEEVPGVSGTQHGG